MRHINRKVIITVAALGALLPAIAAADGAVTVDLAEFTVTPDVMSVEAGQVDFTVNNVGQFGHELAIVRTDLAADALPVDGDGRVDESTLDLVGRVDRFVAADGTMTLSVDMTAGSYVLYCNVGPHYDRGMTIAFQVTEAATPTTTAAPTAASSGGAGLVSDAAGGSLLLVGLLALTLGAVAIGGRRLTARD